jgi:hypothetical protein
MIFEKGAGVLSWLMTEMLEKSAVGRAQFIAAFLTFHPNLAIHPTLFLGFME